jgi:hypothetical protein
VILISRVLRAAGEFDRALEAISQAERLVTDAAETAQLRQFRERVERERRATALLVEGTRAFEANQFARAATALTEAWRLAPELEADGLRAAQAWWRIEEYGRAVELLRQLARGRSPEVRAGSAAELARGAGVIEERYRGAMAAGRQGLAQGNVAAAEMRAREAVLFGADKPDAQLLLASVLIRASRPSEAVRAIEEAVRLGWLDRAELTRGEAFKPLFQNPDYRALLRNVFGDSALAALAVQDRILAARSLRSLADQAAAMQRVRDEAPDHPDARSAAETAFARLREFETALQTALRQGDPAQRVAQLRTLRQRFPSEAAIAPALASAELEDAAARAAADQRRIAAEQQAAAAAAERARQAAIAEARDRCTAGGRQWRFTLVNTSDHELFYTLNGMPRTLASGNSVNEQHAERVWRENGCADQATPWIEINDRLDRGGIRRGFLPIDGTRYQFIHDRSAVALQAVTPATPQRVFGALARTVDGTRYFGTMSNSTFRNAETAALSNCAPAGPCQIERVFWDSCVAVWQGRGGNDAPRRDYARRPTQDAANEAARAACGDLGLAACTIILAFCHNGQRPP